MCSAAWGDDVTFVKDAVIGTADNSGGWFSGSSNVMDIPANKTLTLKFKTYSATDEQLGTGAWGASMSHVIRIGYTDGSNDHILFWRADGWGWLDNEKIGGKWATTGSDESNDNSWVACNEANMRWGTGGADFRQDITGSDVTVTIMRKGSNLMIIQDFEATSGKYRRYFVMNTGSENGWLWAQMVVDHAHIVAIEDPTTTNTNLPLTGILVGKLDKTGRLANHGNIENFTVAPEGSLSLSFVLHSTKLFDWAQWLYEIADASDMYTLCVGNQVSWNALKVGESVTKSANWPATNAELLEKMDGATIDMTVIRSGATVSMTAMHHPVSGDDFSITTSVTPTKEGFATSNITVRPLVELGYLDLLPVSGTIASSGYSTLASGCGLDFANATGLEAAYVVSDITNTTVKLTSVNELPANSGVILKGTPGATYSIPIKSTAAYAGTNKLHAAVTAYNCSANEVYIMQSGQFHHVTAASTVPAGKAYLLASDVPSGARSLDFFFDDETTGVTSIEKGQWTIDNAWYNLNGQKVLNPSKGLYIVNGKKVVIK